MIINFSEKLESVQNDKLKKAIVCQRARDSFIAVTQEIAVMMLEQRTGLSLWHGKELDLDTGIQER